MQAVGAVQEQEINVGEVESVGTAELPARSVKVQQRTSGGSWRTLQGLIDFAVVQSYLSTATKWGLDTLDAMTQLFTTGAWLAPARTPRAAHSVAVDSGVRLRADEPRVRTLDQDARSAQNSEISLSEFQSSAVTLSNPSHQLQFQ